MAEPVTGNTSLDKQEETKTTLKQKNRKTLLRCCPLDTTTGSPHPAPDPPPAPPPPLHTTPLSLRHADASHPLPPPMPAPPPARPTRTPALRPAPPPVPAPTTVTLPPPLAAPLLSPPAPLTPGAS